MPRFSFGEPETDPEIKILKSPVEMPALCAIEGCGQRSTHQRVLLMRLLRTGRILDEIICMFFAGTSESSLIL